MAGSACCHEIITLLLTNSCRPQEATLCVTDNLTHDWSFAVLPSVYDMNDSTVSLMGLTHSRHFTVLPYHPDNLVQAKGGGGSGAGGHGSGGGSGGSFVGGGSRSAHSSGGSLSSGGRAFSGASGSQFGGFFGDWRSSTPLPAHQLAGQLAAYLIAHLAGPAAIQSERQIRGWWRW